MATAIRRRGGTAVDDQPDSGGRRVLTILRYLAEHQRPVLASAIARDCQVPRSSTYRLLHVMEEERFVAYYPDEGRWGLGLSSYALGTGQALSDGLDRNSTSLLAGLAAHTGAFIGLGVLDGTDAVVPRIHRPTSWTGFEPGVRYPAHLTALGRALLIDASREDLLALYGYRRLARPTGRGPGTVDELLGLLRDAAPRGFTESPAELADGVWAYATPIRGAAGRVVAALAAGFLGPPGKASRERAVAALLAGAADISSRLRYQPHDGAATR